MAGSEWGVGSGEYLNAPLPTQSFTSHYARITRTAQAILDARALYPDSSLADLYDEVTMPSELRKAHQANDCAVMEAYGFKHDMSEAEIVAELFKRFQALVEAENKQSEIKGSDGRKSKKSRSPRKKTSTTEEAVD